MKKFLMFGASVTQQSTRHDDSTVVTGYVNHLQELYMSKPICVDRVSCPSNTINDAGIVYLPKVIGIKPDVCFLEWSTPEISTCSKDYVSFIFDRLIRCKILPIPCILPRSDRLNRATEISQYLIHLSNLYGIPYFDLSSHYPPSHPDLKKMLRDKVHTNTYGASIYAGSMYSFIQDNLSFDVLESCMDKALSIAKNGNLKFNVEEFSSHKFKPREHKISFSIQILNSTELSIYADQRVGPWSQMSMCIIEDKLKGLKLKSTVHLYDQWTHRERQCLKLLGTFNHIDPGSYICTIIASAEGSEISNLTPELRISGSLYFLSNSLIKVTL